LRAELDKAERKVEILIKNEKGELNHRNLNLKILKLISTWKSRKKELRGKKLKRKIRNKRAPIT